MRKKKLILSIAAIILFFILLLFLNSIFNSYQTRILRLWDLCYISLSLNLINGFTGQFSLGTAGFMAIGAYTSAVLTMSPAQKAVTYYWTPLYPGWQRSR